MTDFIFLTCKFNAFVKLLTGFNPLADFGTRFIEFALFGLNTILGDCGAFFYELTNGLSGAIKII